MSASVEVKDDKPWNDFLQKELVPIDENPLVRASDLRAETIDFIKNGVPEGTPLGFSALDKLLKIHPGQLTTITGIPNRGKSEVVDAMCCSLAAKKGWKTAFYTPENRSIRFHIAKIISRMTGKTIQGEWKGFDSISESEIERGIEYCNKTFFWVDPDKMEDLSLDAILMNFGMIVAEHKINQIVIDPWNEVEATHGKNQTEANYVSASLGKIKRFARKNNVHVILVAHPRIMAKGKNQMYLVPKAYDISGGAHFYNKSDNIISVHREMVGQYTWITQLHVQKVKSKFDGEPGLALLAYQRATGNFVPLDPKNEQRYLNEVVSKQE